jgi:hypothetical protein
VNIGVFDPDASIGIPGPHLVEVEPRGQVGVRHYLTGTPRISGQSGEEKNGKHFRKPRNDLIQRDEKLTTRNTRGRTLPVYLGGFDV